MCRGFPTEVFSIYGINRNDWKQLTYALREHDIMKEKASREASDKKCKAAQKEKEEAVTKMKNAVADKTKHQHVADSRVSISSSYKQ